jgi:hypothetical protein
MSDQAGPPQNGQQLASAPIPNANQAAASTTSPGTKTTVKSLAVAAVQSEVSSPIGQDLLNWIKKIYASNKILFYVIIPLALILLFIVKFHQILIDLIIGNSKNVLKDAHAQDATLAAKATQDDSQANALVQQAQNLSNQQPTVKDNWYEK